MATLGMTFYEKGGWGGPFDHMEGGPSTGGGRNRQPISRFWPVGTFYILIISPYMKNATMGRHKVVLLQSALHDHIGLNGRSPALQKRHEP